MSADSRNALGVSTSKRELLARLLQAEAAPGPSPSATAPQGDTGELSHAQERLWFLAKLDPGLPDYNVARAWRLKGELDRDAIVRSLAQLIARHEILGASFPDLDGRPTRRMRTPAPLDVAFADASDGGEQERESTASRFAADAARQPFDTATGPLFRASLLKLGRDDHVLVIATHHLVFDGWSSTVLVRELGALYNAHVMGSPADLPALTMRYADFVRWERARPATQWRASLAYWRQQLAGAPEVTALPTDWPRPASRDSRGERHRVLLPGSKADFDAFSRRQGATTFMTMTAAFVALLHGHTGAKDIVVGMPVANRPRIEFEGVVGRFANMLPLRSRLDGDPPFATVLAQLRQTALGAHAHQDVPFEQIVDALGPRRTPGCSPLVQVVCGLQSPSVLSLRGLSATPLDTFNGHAKFDLTLTLSERSDQLVASFEFRTDLFDAGTIAAIAGRFRHVTGEMLRDPGQRLSILVPRTAAAAGTMAEPRASRRRETSAGPDIALEAGSLEAELAGIWRKVLGIPAVGVHDDFFDLGGNSLLAVLLAARIEKRCGVAVTPAVLFEAPTVSRLAAWIRERGAALSWSPLVAIQPNGDRPPFFCVHGAGGHVVGYADLARRLGPDQPVYGLQAIGLDGRQVPETDLQAMAARYVTEIRSLQPRGPYYLGGLSFGGVVAFEMARALDAQGERVGLLALFDTTRPGHWTSLSKRQRFSNYARRVRYHGRQLILRTRTPGLPEEEVQNRAPEAARAHLARGLHAVQGVGPGPSARPASGRVVESGRAQGVHARAVPGPGDPLHRERARHRSPSRARPGLGGLCPRRRRDSRSRGRPREPDRRTGCRRAGGAAARESGAGSTRQGEGGIVLDVTVAVVPRERFSLTERSLENLYENTTGPFELIYVCAGAPGPVRRYLEREASGRGFRLMATDRYLSPNQARNRAMREVSTKYVVFLDNDALVTPGWLEKLVQCAEDTGAAVVGPLYLIGEPEQQMIHMAGGRLHFKDRDGHRVGYDEHVLVDLTLSELREPIRRQPCDFVEFHCMLLRSDLFDRVGPLDERLMSVQEHIDVGSVARQAGASVYLEPDAIASYVPPPPFAWSDLPYFMLRWSDEWTTASVRHFNGKWGVASMRHYGDEDSSLDLEDTIVRFARAHRRLAAGMRVPGDWDDGVDSAVEQARLMVGLMLSVDRDRFDLALTNDVDEEVEAVDDLGAEALLDRLPAAVASADRDRLNVLIRPRSRGRADESGANQGRPVPRRVGTSRALRIPDARDGTRPVPGLARRRWDPVTEREHPAQARPRVRGGPLPLLPARRQPEDRIRRRARGLGESGSTAAPRVSWRPGWISKAMASCRCCGRARCMMESRAQPLTLAVAATFTAQSLQQPLEFWFDELDIDARVAFAPYNQPFQELLDPASLLSTNGHGVNVLLIRLEDWQGTGAASEFLAAVRAAAERLPVPWLVVFCPASPSPDQERRRELEESEDRLAGKLARVPGVDVIRSAELLTAYPVPTYHDPQGDTAAHAPYTPLFTTAVATVIARRLHHLTRTPYKAIVVDCDNTLWTGICGEDGPQGIVIDGPRRAIQEYLVELHDKGILVCLCSRNNEADVLAVFDARSADMPLKHEHVVASRFNWRSKSENIEALASDLNLTPGAFVFLDDDPVECAEVQARCPQVLTIQLPRDVTRIPALLRNLWIFDGRRTTEEARTRTALYSQNADRARMRDEAPTLADFIARLESEGPRLRPHAAPSVEGRGAHPADESVQHDHRSAVRGGDRVRSTPGGALPHGARQGPVRRLRDGRADHLHRLCRRVRRRHVPVELSRAGQGR